MSQIIFTDQLHNTLVDTLHEIARQNNIKITTKRFLDMQSQFFQGAFTVIDTLNANGKSEVTPSIYFAIQRGDIIKKR